MEIKVSIGEVVDKASILEIKLEKFKDQDKRANVIKEYTIIKEKLRQEGIFTDTEEYRILKKVNMKLWEIEDRIRKKEQQQSFDDEFIQLARAVYINNDERAAIKKRINLKYGSDLIEEKEYVEYKRGDSSE